MYAKPINLSKVFWGILFLVIIGISTILGISSTELVSRLRSVWILQNEIAEIQFPPDSELIYTDFGGCAEGGWTRATSVYLSDLSPEETVTFFRNANKNSKWDFEEESYVPRNGVPTRWSVDAYWPPKVEQIEQVHLALEAKDAAQYYQSTYDPRLSAHGLNAKTTLFTISIKQVSNKSTYLQWEKTVSLTNWNYKVDGCWTLETR